MAPTGGGGRRLTDPKAARDGQPTRPDALTLAAFGAMVLLAGGNAVGIVVVVDELDPMWGAAVRFIPAGIIFAATVVALHVPLPTGGALVGAILYGLVGTTVGFGLAFWALQRVPAGTGQVLLALVPLLTLFLAFLHGIERLHLRPVVGALVALVGVAIVAADRLGGEVTLLSILAVVGAAFALAEAGVLVKLTPRAHWAATNAIGLTIGGLGLLAISALAGERWLPPAQTDTWVALVYLAIAGSFGVFGLYIVVLGRWTASGASHQFLLIPIATVTYSAVLTGEPITTGLVLGGLVIIGGVYLGALSGQPHRAD